MSYVTDFQERLGTRCLTFWRAFEEETNIVLGVAREYSRLSSTLVARNVLQQTSQLGSVRWSVYRIQHPLPKGKPFIKAILNCRAGFRSLQ